MIVVDPDLNAGLLRELWGLLAPYPNFFVIQHEFKNTVPNLRYPASFKLSAITGGDVDLLKTAMQEVKSKVYVETNLDVEDGLPFYMLQYLREQANQRLEDPGNNNAPSGWLVECILRTVAWQPAGQGDANKSGLLKLNDFQNFCPRAGLTKAFAPGVGHSDMPAHTEVTMSIGRCDQPSDTACWYEIDHVAAAVRALTPISGGDASASGDFSDGGSWSDLFDIYGIKREDVFRMGKHLDRNSKAIARENAGGQW